MSIFPSRPPAAAARIRCRTATLRPSLCSTSADAAEACGRRCHRDRMPDLSFRARNASGPRREEVLGRKTTVKILYFTQLLGLALGLRRARSACRRISPTPRTLLRATRSGLMSDPAGPEPRPNRGASRCQYCRRQIGFYAAAAPALADELLSLGEAMLESLAGGPSRNTHATSPVEGFRLLALHRQGAKRRSELQRLPRNLPRTRLTNAIRLGAMGTRWKCAPSSPRRHGGAPPGSVYRRQARSGGARRILLRGAAAATTRGGAASRNS